MSEESRSYTSLSIHKELKEELEDMRRGDETFSQAIWNAIADEKEFRDGIESRLDHLTTIQHEQSRLLVRMAVAQGLEKEQIPRNLAEYESWGASNPFAALASDEETVDVHGDEKRARMQAREEVLNLERGEDGFMRPQGEDYEREGDVPNRSRLAGGSISDEQREQIEQRTAEILAADESGGNPPWESENQ